MLCAANETKTVSFFKNITRDERPDLELGRQLLIHKHYRSHVCPITSVLYPMTLVIGRTGYAPCL